MNMSSNTTPKKYGYCVGVRLLLWAFPLLLNSIILDMNGKSATSCIWIRSATSWQTDTGGELDLQFLPYNNFS